MTSTISQKTSSETSSEPAKGPAREPGVGTVRSREDILAAQRIRSPRVGTCKVEGMACAISEQD